jgi:hypothetical protein
VSTGLPPSPLPLPASSTSGVKVKGGNSSARISQEANAPQHFSGKKISKRNLKAILRQEYLKRRLHLSISPARKSPSAPQSNSSARIS